MLRSCWQHSWQGNCAVRAVPALVAVEVTIRLTLGASDLRALRHFNTRLTILPDNRGMKHFALTAMLLAFALPASADELVEYGREIAEANCASCHAISTDDASQHPEAPPLRELSARYPLDALEEAFVEGVYVGHPDMPEFEASPDLVNALLAYLETIQNPTP